MPLLVWHQYSMNWLTTYAQGEKNVPGEIKIDFQVKQSV
jgi:hypothetical protein